MRSHFALVDDLDLIDCRFYAIGNEDHPFQGVFSGGGHAVSNLAIEGNSLLGLFGVLGDEAVVKELGLIDVNVVGSGDYSGGLAGSNSGSVIDCYSTGAVRGEDSVGGLVGSNYGSITGSHSIVTVCGTDAVGGLVGSSTYKLYGPPLSTISGCSSASAVTGDTCVGGLVGGNTGSVVTSYSTGAVTGREQVGGLVGDNWFNRFLSSTAAWIADCYSTSTVAGDTSVGGLVGSNRSASIAASYSTGAVRGDDNVGGFVGVDEGGDVTQCFWDAQISGQTDSDAGTGLTIAEMQVASTFLEVGWDFIDESENGTEDIWKIAEGLDYPRLWWEEYDGQVTLEVGQRFTVTLESNPSTGYRWEWVDRQESILEQMGEVEFKPRETGDPPLVGAGGWDIFTFEAVSPGQMTLKLVYRRPWEEGMEPLKTFSLQVVVP